MKVHTLKEAMNFFLENAEGSIICVNRSGEEKECKSYLEAEEFYIDEL